MSRDFISLTLLQIFNSVQDSARRRISLAILMSMFGLREPSKLFYRGRSSGLFTETRSMLTWLSPWAAEQDGNRESLIRWNSAEE